MEEASFGSLINSFGMAEEDGEFAGLLLRNGDTAYSQTYRACEPGPRSTPQGGDPPQSKTLQISTAGRTPTDAASLGSSELAVRGSLAAAPLLRKILDNRVKLQAKP